MWNRYHISKTERKLPLPLRKRIKGQGCVEKDPPRNATRIGKGVCVVLEKDRPVLYIISSVGRKDVENTANFPQC